MLVVGTAWGIDYILVYQRNDASVGGGALRALDISSSVGSLVCFLVALDSAVAGYPLDTNLGDAICQFLS